jgi:hypothetical protein
MIHEKNEYTAAEAAQTLQLDVTTLLKHKAKFEMGKDKGWWWYNEKREFRCTSEFIEALKNRTTRGKYLRKKK